MVHGQAKPLKEMVVYPVVLEHTKKTQAKHHAKHATPGNTIPQQVLIRKPLAQIVL
jgi:hypothetical protein